MIAILLPRWLALGPLFLVLFWGAGCYSTADDLTVSRSQIDAPEGNYTSVAWPSEDSIIAAFEPVALLDEDLFGLDLWRIALDSTISERLDLPEPNFTYCHSVRFHDPAALADGRFAFVRECEQDRGFVSELLVSTPGSSAVSPLFPLDPLSFKFAGYSLTPDGSKALTSIQEGMGDDLTLVSGTESRRIYGEFERANNPAWSPGGDAFVFFGNEAIYGDPSRRWQELSYHFWLVDTGCEVAGSECSSEPVLMLQNFYPGGRPQWSPDGRWVAYSGTNWIEDPGLFLRNMENGGISRIATGEYRDIAWAPDGQRLVAILEKPNLKDNRFLARSSLEVFDLTGAAPLPNGTKLPSGSIQEQELPSLTLSNVNAENISPVELEGVVIAGSAIEVTFTIRNDGPGDYPGGSNQEVPLAVIWTANGSNPQSTILPSTTIEASHQLVVKDTIYLPPESPFHVEAWLKPLLPTPLAGKLSSSVVSQDFDDLQSADIGQGEAALLLHPVSADWTLLVQVLNVGNAASFGGVDISVPVRDLEAAVTLSFQKSTLEALLPGACQWVIIPGGQLQAGEPLLERSIGFRIDMRNPDGVAGLSPMDPNRWNNLVAMVVPPMTTTTPATEVARQIDPDCGGLP
ncbi:MAG: WD40-like Beta Propeller Repeat [Chloroflexi bacterium]|jgi:hypothetical protein|nr:MAG: WD40-like Beta Propeller Repeat [Chloroflexota bacterium]